VLTALSRLGVIMVPIMPIYRRDDVSYVLANAGVRAVFTPSNFGKFDYLDMYLGLRKSIRNSRSSLPGPTAPPRKSPTPMPMCSPAATGGRRRRRERRQELHAPPNADEPFVTVYTSGTTSRPKGCVHTFNTIGAGSRALIGPFGYTEADVQFGPSPIAHTTGLVTSVCCPC